MTNTAAVGLVARRRRLLQKAWTTLMADGPLALARASHAYLEGRHRSWRDARLDRRFGIDTLQTQGTVTRLKASDDHAGHGGSYEPIQLHVYDEIVRRLPIPPNDYCFIDFGSGKGRALILAAESGFRQAIGVEYAESLHAAAERNIAIYRRLRPKSGPIESRWQDAASFVLPDCDGVLFFYNPFDAVVMRKVLGRVRQSWLRTPRDLLAIYRTPLQATVFEEEPLFRPLVVHRDYRIYRTLGGPRFDGGHRPRR